MNAQQSALTPGRATRHLFTTSRPVSWVNTAYPFAAAWILAGGALDARFWVGCLFFLLPYNLAMYGINDVFDYESDLRNPRKGGVEGDVLDRRMHRTVIVASVVTCVVPAVYLLVTSSAALIPMLLLSLFAVAAYSVRGLRFKEVPVLDSVTSSTHFSSPAWCALAALGVWPSTEGWLALTAFFLWGVASQAFGAVQDIEPDRAAGLGSVATVLGARTTVVFSLVAYAVAGVLVAFTGPFTGWMAVCALAYVVSVARFVRITDATSADAHRGWTTFLWLNYAVGFVLTMLLIARVALG